MSGGYKCYYYLLVLRGIDDFIVMGMVSVVVILDGCMLSGLDNEY
jgi:hypothetical protein